MVNVLSLSLVVAAPWLVAIGWTWSRAPRRDDVPPATAQLARERLWLS